jgi:hypothetical protein
VGCECIDIRHRHEGTLSVCKKQWLRFQAGVWDVNYYIDILAWILASVAFSGFVIEPWLWGFGGSGRGACGQDIANMWLGKSACRHPDGHRCLQTCTARNNLA